MPFSIKKFPVFFNVKTIAFYVVVIGLSSSCHKYVSYTPLSSDFKQVYNYKKGSYWIMQDSLSGEIDSFWVYSKENIIAANSYGHEENIVIDIRQQGVGSPDSGVVWDLILYDGANLDLSYADPVTGDTVFYSNIGGGHPIKYGQAVTVKGLTYDSCYIAEVGGYLKFTLIKTKFIRNEHDGFIKINQLSTKRPRIWELIRKSINIDN